MTNSKEQLQTRLARLSGYLTMDSDNLRLLREHAGCASQVQEFEKALGSLARIDALGGAMADDLALRSHCLRSLGRLDEAEALLGRALQNHLDHPWLRLENAALLLQRRCFEEVLHTLPAALDDDHLASLAAEYRIRSLHHLGRLEEAVAFGEAELTLRPDDLRVRSSLCPILCDLGRLSDAALHAETVTTQIGPQYDVLETLASVALRDGDPVRAREWMRTALSTRQDDGRAWLLDGLISFRQGQPSEAIDSMQRAIELMPGHAGSHLALGWVHLIGQEPEKAMEAFLAATEASPAFSEVYGSQAVAALILNRRELASRMIRKAKLLDPASPTAEYAALLLNGGSVQEVRLLAEQLLKGWGAQPMQKQLSTMKSNLRTSSK